MPQNTKNQGGCHAKKKCGIFQPSCSQSRQENLGRCEYRLQEKSRRTFDFLSQSNHASKKWRALMRHFGRWLLFEQLYFFQKHVTLSQKMHLALPVSIRRHLWISELRLEELSLSISEHCKKNTKGPCLLQHFSSFLYSWPYWHQVSYFHACRGQIC